MPFVSRSAKHSPDRDITAKATVSEELPETSILMMVGEFDGVDPLFQVKYGSRTSRWNGVAFTYEPSLA